MRRILFLVLMLSSIGVWAEDYYWYGYGKEGSSPSELCPIVVPIAHPDNTYAGTFAFFSNGLEVRCHSFKADGTYGPTVVIRRGGDSCPEGTEYNPATGSCDEPDDPNQCEDKAGQSTSWGYNIPGYDGTSSGLSEFGCIASCRADLGTFSCFPYTDGSGDGYCIGSGTFTGGSCVAGDPSIGSFTPPPTDPGEGDGDNPGCPPPYVWNGNFCQVAPPPNCMPGFVLNPDTNTCVPGDSGDGDGSDSGDGDGDAGGEGDGGGSGGSGPGGGSGGDGSGGGGEGSGDGSGSGNGGGGGGPGGSGNDGDDEEDEGGETPGMPVLGEFGEDVGTFQESVDSFVSRVSESELISSLTGISSSAPSGSCSISTVHIWFFDFDAGSIFCGMAPSLLVPLYPLFLAIWAFAAVRVLFSA